jgi:hypothetical protein
MSDFPYLTQVRNIDAAEQADEAINVLNKT